jgi:hypothetical protein
VLLVAYVAGNILQQWRGGGERALSWSDIRYLGVVTVLSFFAAGLNPNGAELWVYPFLTLGSSAMQVYIQEWHSPDFHVNIFWPFVVMLALGVLSLIFTRKRPSWDELLLFGGTAAAGLLSARNIPLFAIVSAPIIGRHVLSSLEGTAVCPLLSGEKQSPPPISGMKALNWVIFIAAACGVLLWTADKIGGNQAAIVERYPVEAVNYLEANGLADAPGYNSYNWGGYLIWRGLPVFVDGRADVYGDPFLFYYLQAFEVGRNWREPLNDYQVQYVLMEKDAPLMTLLQASGQWREVYSDDVAQIFVRQ